MAYGAHASVLPDLGSGWAVCVADREADGLELFEAQRERPEVDLLARANGRSRIPGHMHGPRGPQLGPIVIWRGYVTHGGMCIGCILAMEQREWERLT
ncbi:MAG: hypothetical protein OXI81_08895 [Paracoccaceae bacterium]|nr:hypothetical protein [Paracoccaceae bacterium]